MSQKMTYKLIKLFKPYIKLSSNYIEIYMTICQNYKLYNKIITLLDVLD